MSEPSAVLQAALEYAARGWSVFPAHSIRNGKCTCGRADCGSPGKHPRTKHGVRDATRDPDTIRRLFRSESNVAIATGAISRIDVLDVDNRHGGAESLHELERKNAELPRTPMVLTGGGGCHLYLVHVAGLKNLAGELGAGLDIRTDGGYVIAPPSVHASGRPYVWEGASRPSEVQVAPFPEWLRDLALSHSRPGQNGTGLQGAAPLIPEVIRDGVKHSTCVSLAGTLRRRGFTVDEITPALVALGRRFETPVPEENLKRIAEDACRSWQPDSKADVGTASGEKPAHYNHTDLGNAERLIQTRGNDLHYCGKRDAWFMWDGRRWRLDEAREIDKWANQTIRDAYAEAGRIEDSDRRKEFLKFLLKSESNGALTAMVQRARSIAVNVDPSELDGDPWLLNCTNGVVNLRSGQFLPHSRDYLVTKITGAPHDPKAQCPTFQRFIHRIMGNHPDASEAELERADRLVKYLQKVFGYAATANVSEKAVFVFYGLGNNGKTTLLEIIRAVLGDYAGTIQIESLMTRQSDNSVNTDLADLAGKRFVSSSECEDGQRLAVARLKHLSGMGQLKARRLRENMFEFQPTRKLFLDSNFKPVIRGTEEATWDRLHCVPFTVTIPRTERDKNLLTRMKSELPGVLAWIIEGARRWLTEGLERTTEVERATQQYREESDPLRDFLEDRCLVDPDACVISGDLWKGYLKWADDAGEKYTLSRRRFAECLEVHGFKNVRDTKARRWQGLNLKFSMTGL